MTSRLIAALLLGLMLWGAPRGADAQTMSRADRARTHYVDGVMLERSGDWYGAERELRTAHALSKHPRIAFELGLVYVQLDDPVRATKMMKAALRGRTRLDPEVVERAREVVEQQEPAISVIMIETPVSGARVRINGRDVGKTPLGRPVEVRSGVIDVELTAPGRAPEHAVVTVKPGFQQSVELDLDEPGGAAQLKIATDLPGAEILVDGERRGMTRQWDIIYVEPGTHEVALRREGYVSDGKQVSVAPTGVTEVKLTAERDPATTTKGTLVVAVEPSDARVYLDGRSVEAGPVEVVPGLHEIRVERAMHLTVSNVVAVEASERKAVDVRLPPTAETRDEIVDEAEGQRSMAWAFGALGLGLTVGGVAVMTTGIVRRGAAKEDEQNVRASRSCDLGEPECQAGIDDAKADQKVSLGVALGGAGGLALGLGSFALSVWLYLEGEDPDALRVEVPGDLATIRWRPDVVATPEGAFAGLRGTF